MRVTDDLNQAKEARPTRVPVGGFRHEDYLTYRPLMLRMLGSLARNGYAVPPDDGLDIVHDFFAEAWIGVVRRHDPDKAQFRTFLQYTFLAFARPRIIRLARWRTTLLDPSEMTRLQDVSHAVSWEREHVEHVHLVRAVVQSMAPPDRRLFQLYVSGVRSEREIASQFRLTRYGLRMKIVDLFGEFAVRFGQLSATPVTNNLIVNAIWHQHRTVKEAASFLKIPVPEVQAVRSRMYRILVMAVKGDTMGSGIGFYVTRPSEGETVTYAAVPDAGMLLRRALTAGPGERDEAMADIHRHASIVVRYLETWDGPNQFADVGAETFARIYQALADAESDEIVSPVGEAYAKAAEDEEIVIGQAFKQCLVANLPDHLLRVEAMFDGIDRLQIDDYRYLISDRSVECGGPFAKDLALFGVTPTNLLQASLGIARLARRRCAGIGASPGAEVTLTNVPGSGPGSIGPDELRQAVSGVTQLDAEVSTRISGWLLRVAGYVPLLFDMFDAEPVEGGVRLRLTDRRENDLYVRWNGSRQLA